MSAIAEAVADGVLPGRVWLYANYHCNLTCTYCLTESAPKVAKRELGAQRMLEVAAEARALGFTSLGVTGGEPFLLSYLTETISKMAEMLPIVVLTNGTLFTHARLEEARGLAGAPVALQISLDSADPVANDTMRGPDNFRRVVAAIDALVARGVRVRIATTAEHIDEHELERLCELHRGLGVADEDHVVRPIVRRGRAIDSGLGVDTDLIDLSPELTITADGAYWSPFGPTVHGGRLDTDLLVSRTTSPLDKPARILLRLVQGRAPGDDAKLDIR